MTEIRKAVIPAAGFGTRMLPASKAVPKELLPIVDVPSLQLIVEEAVRCGITDILIVLGRGKDAIVDHFDRSPELEVSLEKSGKFDLMKRVQAISDLANITFVRQKEMLGLGHAILAARAFVGDDKFAVLLPDDLLPESSTVLRSMLDASIERDASVVAFREVPLSEIHNYGCAAGPMVGSDMFKIETMIEKPSAEKAFSSFGVMGRYVFKPDLLEALATTPPGLKGEIHITDAQIALLEQGDDQYGWIVRDERYDVGQPFGYVRATLEWALARDDIGSDVRQLIQKLAHTGPLTFDL